MVTASDLSANGEGRLYRLPDGRVLRAKLSYMGLKHFFEFWPFKEGPFGDTLVLRWNPETDGGYLERIPVGGEPEPVNRWTGIWLDDLEDTGENVPIEPWQTRFKGGFLPRNPSGREFENWFRVLKGKKRLRQDEPVPKEAEATAKKIRKFYK